MQLPIFQEAVFSDSDDDETLKEKSKCDGATAVKFVDTFKPVPSGSTAPKTPSNVQIQVCSGGAHSASGRTTPKRPSPVQIQVPSGGASSASVTTTPKRPSPVQIQVPSGGASSASATTTPKRPSPIQRHVCSSGNTEKQHDSDEEFGQLVIDESGPAPPIETLESGQEPREETVRSDKGATEEASKKSSGESVQVSELKKRIEGLEQQLRAFEDEDGIRAQLEFVKQKLNMKIAEAEESENSLLHSLAENASLKDDLDTAKEKAANEVELARQEKDRAFSALDTAKQQLISTKKKLEASEKTVMSKNSQLAEARSKADQLKSQLQEKISLLQQRSSEIEAKKTELNEKFSEILQLKSEVATKKREVKVLEIRLKTKGEDEKLRDERNAAYNDVKKRDTFIAELVKSHNEEKAIFKKEVGELRKVMTSFNNTSEAFQGMCTKELEIQSLRSGF